MSKHNSRNNCLTAFICGWKRVQNSGILQEKLCFPVERVLPWNTCFKERFLHLFRGMRNLWFKLLGLVQVSCSKGCEWFFIWVDISKWDFSAFSHMIQEVSVSSCQNCYMSSAAKVVWYWPLKRKVGQGSWMWLGQCFYDFWYFPSSLMITFIVVIAELSKVRKSHMPQYLTSEIVIIGLVQK